MYSVKNQQPIKIPNLCETSATPYLCGEGSFHSPQRSREAEYTAEIFYKQKPEVFASGFDYSYLNYFFRYITSFTSFTVLSTSGMASAARFGA